MSFDFKNHIATRIRDAAKCYVGDMEALTQDQLNTSPGGSARSPFDFTYEVIFVNRRLARRIRGETPDPVNFEGWIVAPDEYKNKEYAISEFKSSVDDVLNAWNGLDEADFEKPIPLPQGEPTNPAKLGSLCATHIAYHDAQLNYLQAMLGDGEMHWD